MGELSRLNYQIFVFVLENAPVFPKGWTYAIPRGAEREIHVAASRLAADPGSSLVFTLGSASNGILLSLTDGDPERVAAILATIEELFARQGGVGSREIVDLSDPYLRDHGRVAAALLRPVAGVPGFPDLVRIEGAQYHAALAVFLNEEERELSRRLGFDALEERFRLCGRNVARLASAR
jgi:hypothetical protein